MFWRKKNRGEINELGLLLIKNLYKLEDALIQIKTLGVRKGSLTERAEGLQWKIEERGIDSDLFSLEVYFPEQAKLDVIFWFRYGYPPFFFKGRILFKRVQLELEFEIPENGSQIKKFTVDKCPVKLDEIFYQCGSEIMVPEKTPVSEPLETTTK